MPRCKQGFTLVELLIGAAMLALAVSALLGAFFGQAVLNEHARNLTWAVNDAGRVMEQVRRLNTGAACTQPSASSVPAGFASWNLWLANAAGGGGKSIQPTPDTNELIVVTCRDNTTLAYCGDTDQVSAGEWIEQGGVDTNFDPVQIVVAACWRHGQRTIGECTWNAGTSTLTPSDTDGDGVIESPGMLMTVVTCRR
jgi:prepilin-type N-terminal cleavage/methylation domain-containing protein